MKAKDIVDAWARIRTIDQTIPDDVLDFMKDAAIKALEEVEEPKLKGYANVYWDNSFGSISDDLEECRSRGNGAIGILDLSTLTDKNFVK